MSLPDPSLARRSRRGLILGAALGAAGLAIPALRARPAGAVTVGDNSRFLWIRNGAGEEVAAAFRSADGSADWNAMARLQHLFRDLRTGAPGPLPITLLDILSLIQEGWRHERPLLLHSGYRTPGTNAALEGAARASLHLEGQAADFELRGASVGDLARAAWSFSRLFDFMGVGIYPRFLHVDIGPRRGWARPQPAQPQAMLPARPA